MKKIFLKRSKRAFKIKLWAFAFCCCLTYTCGAQLINYLPEQAKSTMTKSQRHYFDVAMSWPYSIQARLATINIEQLKENTIFLNYDKETYVSQKYELPTKFDGVRHSWIGNVFGLNGSVHIVYKRDEVVGLIELENKAFLIRPLGEGLHAIIDWDLSMDDGCMTTSGRPSTKNSNPVEKQRLDNLMLEDKIELPSKSNSASSTGECNIRVLVAYTDDADQAVTDILMDITNMVNLANTGAINSSGTGSPIDWSIELAVAYEVNYNETGDMDVDLNCFQQTSDGCLDNVHIQRILWNADQCALLTSTGSGLAKVSLSYGDQFSVTGVPNFYALTFHHELAHNAECTHAINQSDEPGTAPYAGWGEPTTGCFRTVMAYPDACGMGNCPRHNIFSDDDANSWSCRNSNYTPGTTNNRNQDRLHLSGPVIIDYEKVAANLLYIGHYNWTTGESAHVVAGEELTYESSSSNNFTLQNGSEGSFRAGRSVKLGRGFHAKSGTSFRAYIDKNCTPFELADPGNANSRWAEAENVFDDSQSEAATNPAKFDQSPQIESKAYEFKVYPTIFSDAITVEFKLPQATDVNVSIFDLTGRKIKTISDVKQMGAGFHRIVHEINDLQAGMYQIYFQTPDKNITQKLIKAQ